MTRPTLHLLNSCIYYLWSTLVLSLIGTQLTSCSQQVFVPPQNEDILPAMKEYNEGYKEKDSVDLLAELVALVERSRLIWHQTKEKISDTYSYTDDFISGLVPSASTVITVTNGQITSRKYHRNSSPIEHWVEKGTSIGSHKDGAAEPLTLDKMYEKCLETVLKRNPRSAKFTVATFPDGTLRECWSWACRAVDDAADGIAISSITYIGFNKADTRNEIKSYDGCLSK